jgi:hypothetical protein
LEHQQENESAPVTYCITTAAELVAVNQGPRAMTHYNDPDIGAMDFLTAVMHDPSVSIADRVHAAQAIAQVESVSAIRAIDTVFFTAMMHKQWEDFSAEQQEYFNSLPQHEQDEFMRVLHRFERCNELDVGDVKFMQVKGHG